MELVEFVQRSANVGAACPSGGQLRQRVQGLVQPSPTKQRSDLNQRRAEQKCVNVAEVLLQHEQELHQEHAVGAHRAADVEQCHEPMRTRPAFAEVQVDGLAAVADVAA